MRGFGLMAPNDTFVAKTFLVPNGQRVDTRDIHAALSYISIPWGGVMCPKGLYRHLGDPGSAYVRLMFKNGIPSWIMAPPDNINNGNPCVLRTGNIEFMLQVSYIQGATAQNFEVCAGRGGTKIKYGKKIMLHPHVVAFDSRNMYRSYEHLPLGRLLREALDTDGYGTMFDEFFSWFGYVNEDYVNLSFAAPGREKYRTDKIYTPIGLTGDFEICERSS